MGYNVYMGEIRLFPFSNIPEGWLPCNGQTLPVTGNNALYSAVKNFFGGIPNKNFLLPNLNGRVIVGAGISKTKTNYPIGKEGGAETVFLTARNLPAHNHLVNAAETYDSNNSANRFLGNPNTPATTTQTNKNLAEVNLYAPGPIEKKNLNPDSIHTTGDNRPHENRMPYMALCYCIAIEGEYPIIHY